jgi:hypothetical protein
MGIFIMHFSFMRPRLRLCLLFLLLPAAGCSTRTIDALPPTPDARGALETALKAWCDGARPGTISCTEPVVQVVDTPWGQGERLKSFEILGEDRSASQLKFSVRLALAKPDKVEEANYYVLGRGPVMIFREEDYLRNINMEDGPRTTKNTRPGWRRGR